MLSRLAALGLATALLTAQANAGRVNARADDTSCDSIYAAYSSGSQLGQQVYDDWNLWQCSTWYPSGIGAPDSPSPPSAPPPAPPPASGRTCDSIYAAFRSGAALSAADKADWAAWDCHLWFPSGIGADVDNTRSCDSIHASYVAGTAPTKQDLDDWAAWGCATWFKDGIVDPALPHPAQVTCDTIYGDFKAGRTLSDAELANWAAWGCPTWFTDGPNITAPGLGLGAPSAGQGAVVPVTPPGQPELERATCDSIYTQMVSGKLLTDVDLFNWAAWKCTTWFKDAPVYGTSPPPATPPSSAPPPPPSVQTCDTIFADFKAGKTLSDSDRANWAAWSCITWFKDGLGGDGSPSPSPEPTPTPPPPPTPSPPATTPENPTPPALKTCDSMYADYKSGKTLSDVDHADWAAWSCATWFKDGPGTDASPPPATTPPPPSSPPTPLKTCDTIYEDFKSGKTLSEQDHADWTSWSCGTWYKDGPTTPEPTPPPVPPPAAPPADTPAPPPPASSPVSPPGTPDATPAKKTCDTMYASFKSLQTLTDSELADWAAWSCDTWFKDGPTSGVSTPASPEPSPPASTPPSPPPPSPPASVSDTAYSDVEGGRAGTASTTRYWDCCKPSCGWSSNTNLGVGARSCSASGGTLSSTNIKNACNGGGDNGPEDGSSYTCIDTQPWAVSDALAFGFAAAPFPDTSECCACYELTFTDGPAAGKKMVVQKVNTGGDLASNQFDLQIPGGGLGIFDGCSAQFGVDANTWGQRYGGVSSADGCSVLPAALQDGCRFRFGWLAGADNPAATFKRVTCPQALVAKSACSR